VAFELLCKRTSRSPVIKPRSHDALGWCWFTSCIYT